MAIQRITNTVINYLTLRYTRARPLPIILLSLINSSSPKNRRTENRIFFKIDECFCYTRILDARTDFLTDARLTLLTLACSLSPTSFSFFLVNYAYKLSKTLESYSTVPVSLGPVDVLPGLVADSVKIILRCKPAPINSS